MPYFATVGRILLGLFFLAAGATKFMGPASDTMVAKIAAFGLPMADNLYWVAAGFEVAAGVALVLGLWTRLSPSSSPASAS